MVTGVISLGGGVRAALSVNFDTFGGLIIGPNQRVKMRLAK
jgi:hypothetical protein